MRARNWRVVTRYMPRRSPRMGHDLGQPNTCDCDEPDEQPVGGWLPTTFRACRKCGRPLLETLLRRT